MPTLPNGSSYSDIPGQPPKDADPEWHMDFSDAGVSGSQSSRTFFGRLRRAIARSSGGNTTSNYPHDYQAAPTDEDAEGAFRSVPIKTRQKWTWARFLQLLRRFIYRLPLLVLMFFGAIHLIIVLYGNKYLFWDVEERKAPLPSWDGSKKGLASYPTDATRDIRPIPCHSHNDYWRRVPLFDAIHAGCTSVEADVWLYEGNDELLVGHSSTSLSDKRTFHSLYVNPLVDLLDSMNPDTQFGKSTGAGIFDEDPDQTLVLLVDFKTDGHDLFPFVEKQLEPLRAKDYLSHWDGEKFVSRAVTVVGTGNTPFDLLTENPNYRDIFFDAPLDEMYEAAPASNPRHADAAQKHGFKATRGQGKSGTGHLTSPDDFNSTNSYYASVSMFANMGLPVTGKLTDAHLERLRGQIRGAHKRGLKVRYWEVPAWPTSLRNYFWELLVEEGADVLNVDDLEAAAKLDWGKHVKHSWIDG